MCTIASCGTVQMQLLTRWRVLASAYTQQCESTQHLKHQVIIYYSLSTHSSVVWLFASVVPRKLLASKDISVTGIEGKIAFPLYKT